MANYHILEENRRGDSARVAFHIATPAGTNLANRTYAWCIQQYLLSREGQGATEIPTDVPWLQAEDPTEYVQIQNGEVTEYIRNVSYSANAGNAAKQAEMDAEWNDLNASIPGRITSQMKFYGQDQNVT